MNKLILLISINLILQSSTKSQTNFTDSFPLKVGNVFVFKQEYQFTGGPPQISYHKSKVVNDTILGSRIYYGITDFYRAGWRKAHVRLDSINGNLFMYDSANRCPNYSYEVLLDSLGAALDDSVKGCGVTKYKCVDTSSYLIFNNLLTHKVFRYYEYILGRPNEGINKYAKGFGLIYRYGYSSGIFTFTVTKISLTACVINGIVYGDTTLLVGMNSTSNQIPDKHYLFQNFPNPFNPVTNIKFELTQKEFVTLSVRNSLGQEVEILFNDVLPSGTYYYNWNASAFTSGVYFYKLKTENYSEVKRMLLVK